MPKIVYVQPNGVRHTVEVPAGLSVMRGAIDNEIPGIVAECGGACACATCKVSIGADWAGHLMPPEAMEEAMLDGAGPGMRLSCQIEVTKALDGLVVEVPATQY
jgi:ferredoxin, 2Fe-2S